MRSPSEQIACRAEAMALRLMEYGTNIDDVQAVIMRLMHCGFPYETIGRDLEKALTKVRAMSRAAKAAFDAAFPEKDAAL